MQDFGIRTVCQHGAQEMSLYAPFWMVNATSLLLKYKVANSLLHSFSPASPRPHPTLILTA